jgi:predicted nicotinamide N-methyase
MRSAFTVLQPLRGSAPKGLARCSSSARVISTAGEADTIQTTPSSPPPLLLEGDEYILSDEGIARTFYCMEYPHSSQSTSSHKALSVEEVYDLPAARKRFVLRGPNDDSKKSSKKPRIDREATVNLGIPYQIVDFQEIGQGISRGAGTGSYTWESSLAMSMFFSARPQLLRGKIVELGSGTGAGGILMSSLATPSLNRATDIESVTLTDYNTQVLEQCRENIAKATATSSFMKVSRLDWYDFLHKSNESHDLFHKYDTVVICDCAYQYPDIEALHQAMITLLRKDKDSRIHIFGPYNRGAILELIGLLRQDDSQVNVSTELIDMKRFRLEPPARWDDSSLGKTECPFAAKYVAKFLHITCSFRLVDTKIQTTNGSMSEID